MTAAMPTTVFSICTSASDLLDYPDDDDSGSSNAELAKVLELMHIELNLVTLCDYYFDDIPVCEGDILLFSSSRFTESCFIIDLYKERTDRLDCVNFYISSPHQEVIEQVKPVLRYFYDKTPYQIAYEENCRSGRVMKILKCQPGSVCEVVAESGYHQKVIYHSGNFAH